MRDAIKKKLFLLSVIFLISLFALPAFGAELTWLGRPIVDRVNELTLYILKIIGGIFLLMLVLGGIYYAVSGSSPDGQTKAKKTVMFAIMGLTMILVSYVVLMIINQILGLIVNMGG